MDIQTFVDIMGMFLTALFTVGGVLLGYHNYLMRQISQRLKKDTYYVEKKAMDEKFSEIKENSEKQYAEIKLMIEKLGDRVEEDYKKILDHLLNCNRRNKID